MSFSIINIQLGPANIFCTFYSEMALPFSSIPVGIMGAFAYVTPSHSHIL